MDDELRAGPAERAPTDPIRWRVLLVAALVVLVAASAILLDRTLLPGLAAPGVAADRGRSGAWFCPHGGSPGWKGWVALTNPGGSAVRVRISAFGASGGRTLSALQVPPQTEVYREVPATERGAATQVEYFGGWVGASSVVATGSGSNAHATAERCLSGPEPHWYLPDQATGVGETAYLVAMNPFGEVAEFDVSLFTEKRAIRPGTLTPFVVPPGHSVGIKLNEFALLAQDENALAVHVASRVGRIVVGGLMVTAKGLRAEAGEARGAVRWVLPAGGTSAALRLVAFNPGAARADLSVVAQGIDGQQVLSGTSDVSVPAGGVQTFSYRTAPGAGVVVESTNRQPVVVALRASAQSGAPANVAGSASDTSGRWLIMPAVSPKGGPSFVVLENGGRSDAVARITWIGPSGVVAGPPLDAVTVPAGRALQVMMPAGAAYPVSAIVTVTSGGVVPASWASPSQGFGFAVILGLPVPAGS